MKKYRFDWSMFSRAFLRAILKSEKTPQDIRGARYYEDVEWYCPEVETVCDFPDEIFVKNYRQEIEKYFLSENNHVENVVKHLWKEIMLALTVALKKVCYNSYASRN